MKGCVVRVFVVRVSVERLWYVVRLYAVLKGL